MEDKPKRRYNDNVLSQWIMKAIEIIIILAIIYGGSRVTLATLCDDVNKLKYRSDDYGTKITVLETKWEAIKETLDRIEKKLDRR